MGKHAYPPRDPKEGNRHLPSSDGLHLPGGRLMDQMVEGRDRSLPSHLPDFLVEVWDRVEECKGCRGGSHSAEALDPQARCLSRAERMDPSPPPTKQQPAKSATLWQVSPACGATRVCKGGLGKCNMPKSGTLGLGEAGGRTRLLIK